MDDFDDRKDFPMRDETQYRFVYQMSKTERMALRASMWMCVLALMMLFQARKEWEWLFLLLLGIQMGLLALQGFTRQSLLIDPEGVHQRWKIGPLAFSRHLAWKEVERIQLGYSVMEMGVTRTLKDLQCFWFLNRWGELKRQLVFMRDDAQVYAGEGHTLSLLQAIEKFHAVTEQPENEREKLILEAFSIGGKKVGIVACAAMALVLFLVLLIPFSHARALETAEIHQTYRMICYAVGVIAFLAACAYTRLDKETRFPQAFFPNAIFGALCGFMTMPLIDAAPAWMGEKSEETFAVVREEDKAQHWQGTTSPDLAFTLFIPPEERAHRGVGSATTFTIYRGPLGLVSMELEEFRALFADRR